MHPTRPWSNQTPACIAPYTRVGSSRRITENKLEYSGLLPVRQPWNWSFQAVQHCATGPRSPSGAGHLTHTLHRPGAPACAQRCSSSSSLTTKLHHSLYESRFPLIHYPGHSRTCFHQHRTVHACMHSHVCMSVIKPRHDFLCTFSGTPSHTLAPTAAAAAIDSGSSPRPPSVWEVRVVCCALCVLSGQATALPCGAAEGGAEASRSASAKSLHEAR